MLQQTTVERVIPFYKKFLKRFPTVQSLASSPLAAVLLKWQGLGYNRRAKMLHDAAKITMINHSGRLPTSYEELIALPGVGEYTAKAVRVFAYNEPEIMIETNIRAAFIHHFFSRAGRKITDKEIVPYMVQTLTTKNPRMWYAALMDYGAYLKKTVPNPSRKSAHHQKQKPFRGSDREIRGAIIRSAADGPLTLTKLKKLSFPKGRIEKQLAALAREGLLVKRRSAYYVP